MPDVDDKVRPCPSCRMMISVLAIKCRFCGENVGRPKDESRSLSINDLGGETVQHYAPSSSVMDALESFRSEETLQLEEEDESHRKSSVFARPKHAKSEGEAHKPKRDKDMPELDERSKDLASVSLSSSVSYKAKKVAGPNWTRKIGFFAGFVAAIPMLYFGATKVAAVVRDWRTVETVAAPERLNPAVRILEEGGPPEDAVAEAAKAFHLAASDKNEKILDEARRRLESRLDLLMNAPTDAFNKDDLARAAELVNRAYRVDSEYWGDRKKEIDAEVFDYKRMVLISTDVTSRSAVAHVKVMAPDFTSEDVEVSEGDMLVGRFKVDHITRSQVRLVDTQRNNRRWSIRLSGS